MVIQVVPPEKVQAIVDQLTAVGCIGGKYNPHLDVLDFADRRQMMRDQALVECQARLRQIDSEYGLPKSLSEFRYKIYTVFPLSELLQHAPHSLDELDTTLFRAIHGDPQDIAPRKLPDKLQQNWQDAERIWGEIEVLKAMPSDATVVVLETLFFPHVGRGHDARVQALRPFIHNPYGLMFLFYAAQGENLFYAAQGKGLSRRYALFSGDPERCHPRLMQSDGTLTMSLATSDDYTCPVNFAFVMP